MTGVTFLAFGNGSPDVFSTFSAIGAGSGSLAIGELVGAASFITSVVVGSMAIIKPFKVSRAPFLRDVLFFAGCVLFTLYAVADGKITFIESLILIAYYVFYVAFVVFGNWWHQRVKLERELEERARNLYEDDDLDHDSDNDNEATALLDEEQAQPLEPPNIVTRNIPGPYDDYEDEEHDEDGYMTPGRLSVNDLYDSKQALATSNGSTEVNSPQPHLSNDSGGVHDSISLRPPGAPAFKHRPSLMSAIEFSEVVRSLTLSGSRGRIASYDTSYYGSRSPRSPRGSRQVSRPRSATPRSANSLLNPADRSASPFSASPLSATSTPRDPILTPGGSINRNTFTASPTLMEVDQDQLNDHFEQALLRQSLILPDHHDPANHHLGHVHHHQQGPLELQSVESAPMTMRQTVADFMQAVKPIYFPTLLDWKKKTAFVKFLAVTSIPMVLLLTLTLPVVELSDNEDDESVDERNNASSTRLPKITIGDEDDSGSRYEGWSRTATTTQMLLAPVFIAAVITSEFTGIAQIHYSRMQSYVAITWIFLVANEVVGILQAFGMIFGVSDAILGLTIFAMGNSLGDLVANITIAKMGFPRMAFSACFGGPLLNMLLGVGISGTYMTAKTGTHIPLEVSPTLFVSLIGVLLTLLAAIIVVPRSGYMMTRAWGWFLLAMYLVCTVTNVVIEITVSKGNH
ncbi:hypothetical protein BGZ99_008981 [Dissophora globulifera]|uniref:Sodium/calcium exchanger membrane region domain-containing protein n=1 Tax=Dissophora globulifera TaxID=979702 RepID=A0A9P6UP62_9FUNG|nr:hypothetical protein BGZ99_008981 [Dissophora globulifera]